MPTLSQFKNALFDLLFPPRCIGCGSNDGFLCLSCAQSLPKLSPPYCLRCGMPAGGGSVCSQCTKLVAIDGIRSPFLYRGLAREAIIQLKYKRIKALAEPLGQLLASYLSSSPLPIDTLAPVPLHPKRVRERGYNQSSLIAKELGRLTDLAVIEGSLVRLRNTAPQVRITGTEQRQLNVRGAFRCEDRSFQSRRVLVVDDVCTTGATLDACALALKEAGAASVWGLTLAREL